VIRGWWQELAGAGMAAVGDQEDTAFRKSFAIFGLDVRPIDRVSALDDLAGGSHSKLILYDANRR
jgi:hypothetical protein